MPLYLFGCQVHALVAILCNVIKHIKFIGIPVADQDRALAFYTDKLGFNIRTDAPYDDKQRWIELSLPGAQTGVTLFTPAGQEDRVGEMVNTSWAVDDIDKTYNELTVKGVVFEAPPEKQPWGSFLKMRDSEGNQIVLSESRG